MPPRFLKKFSLDLFVMEGRTPGRHVSHAIHTVMQEIYPDRFTGEPINEARAILGNAMERVIIAEIARRYPDRYVQPGQLVYRKIYGTPDLWDLRQWCVVEVKVTWASANRASDIEDVWFWRYWQQGRAYCKMAGMTKVILIIVFINGGYKDGRPADPVIHAWEWEFTEEELDETWDMVEAYA